MYTCSHKLLFSVEAKDVFVAFLCLQPEAINLSTRTIVVSCQPIGNKDVRHARL